MYLVQNPVNIWIDAIYNRQTSLLYQILAFIPGNMLLVHIPLFFQLNPFVAQCLYHLFIIGSPNNIWLKHMHQRFLVFA